MISLKQDFTQSQTWKCKVWPIRGPNENITEAPSLSQRTDTSKIKVNGAIWPLLQWYYDGIDLVHDTVQTLYYTKWWHLVVLTVSFVPNLYFSMYERDWDILFRQLDLLRDNTPASSSSYPASVSLDVNQSQGWSCQLCPIIVRATSFAATSFYASQKHLKKSGWEEHKMWEEDGYNKYIIIIITAYNNKIKQIRLLLSDLNKI